MKTLNYVLMSLLIIGLVACKSTNNTTQTEKVKETTEAKTVANTNTAPKPKPQKRGYNIGDVVSDFSLKNIDGNMVSLSDYEDDKGVILIFTCNHCPYAVMYEDRINDLQNTFAAKGYPVLAINPNDPAVVPEDDMAGMKQRAAEKGFKFPYLFDEGQKIYPVFGATRTPEVYLLKNEGGKMVVAYSGAIDDNHKNADAVKAKYVEDAIEAVTNGNDPDPNFTKAVGCTIKKKKS